MHELSIARSLLKLVEHHTPKGCQVTLVQVRVGPLQQIVPNAMQWAWQAVTQDCAKGQIELKMEFVPWQIHCPSCGRKWQSPDPFSSCVCGQENTTPTGNDEITLIGLEVQDPCAV